MAVSGAIHGPAADTCEVQRNPDAVVRAVSAAILLYAALSYGLLALAAAGVARSFAVVLLWGAAVTAWGYLMRHTLRGKRSVAPVVMLAALLPFAVSLLIPPFRTDDLIYHLLVPERIAGTGRVPFDPHNVNSNLPMLFEMPLVLFELPTLEPWLSPFLINLAVLLGIVGVYWRIAVLHFGVGPRLALGAAIVWAYTPVVFDLSHSCYVELFMTLLVLLAFGHYLAFLSDRTRVARWYCALLLLGLAAATKYLGVVYLALLIAYEFFAFRGQRRHYWGAAALAAVVAAPWYVRNWVVLGNPVFPMLSGLFPSPCLSAERAFQFERLLSNYHDGRGVFDYVLLPFKLLAGYSPSPRVARLGFGGRLSLFFVLSFAAITWRPRTRRLAAALFILYGVFWAVSSQQVRFLLPAATVASLGGLQVLSRQRRRVGRLVAGVLLSAAMLQNLIHIGDAMRENRIVSLLTGRISRDTFLTSHLPISYGFAQHINERLDSSRVRLLTIGNFGRNYYFDVPTVTHTYYDTECFDKAFAADGHDTAVVETFLRENRITHVLFDFGYYRRIHAQSRHVDTQAVERYLAKRFVPLMRTGDVVLLGLTPSHAGSPHS